ncbi:DUF4177 domain-containing protein [Cellulophaga sp. HaHaR_3_176]|uniref:DUF4177 domain-containing protein n=1 Tax=Cellulophaga sp. HaHaR_3_176 TaxID=1942464 RepID=UPI001C1FD875|nr:DUF4177 domain-containing protein [Cellulophaga sp. HaHaR_3_176]QWX84445.1 DUF4177 domain-containing protein [Cellulophaga sp. HaHaR_3_176]
MKEYKIIKQKFKFLKDSDTDFEKTINDHAKQGWIVLNTVFNSSTGALKVILEREK